MEVETIGSTQGTVKKFEITDMSGARSYTVGFSPNSNGVLFESTGNNNVTLASTDYVAQNGGKIDKIKVNGTEQTITNKTVDITVPTKTSDLTNDGDGTSVFTTKTYVDDAVGAITGMEFVIVDALPSTGEKGKIYLVANSGTGSNTYDEYIWVGEGASAKFEKIGTTDIDLSNNWDQTNLEAITTAEIDTLFA